MQDGLINGANIRVALPSSDFRQEKGCLSSPFAGLGATPI
jgi:hypothetical protein